MPATGWPLNIAKGNTTYNVMVRGKKNAVRAGLAATAFPATKKAALKAAERELQAFMQMAPATPTASGKAPIVIFQNPPYYKKRYVRSGTSVVLFDCFYRLYLIVKVSA